MSFITNITIMTNSHKKNRIYSPFTKGGRGPSSVPKYRDYGGWRGLANSIIVKSPFSKGGNKGN
jgi:hypothetical protein